MIIGISVFFILVAFLNVGIRSFVLMNLWNWFIVSFFGVPALSFPIAIGIIFIMNILKPVTIYTNEKSGLLMESVLKMISVNISFPLFLLLIGWIVTFFI